jgi:hypothetical protein
MVTPQRPTGTIVCGMGHRAMGYYILADDVGTCGGGGRTSMH